MAAVNFMKQLRERRKEAAVEIDEEGGGGALSAKIRSLAGDPSAKPEPRDIALLMLSLAVFAAGLYQDDILHSYFRKDKIEKIEADLTSLSSKIGEQERKLASYEGFKSEIDSYDRQVNEFNEKLVLIKSVRIGRNSVVRMVDYIVRRMPSGVWLSSVKLKLSGTAVGPMEGKYGNVDVAGFSETHQDVSQFLGQLEGTSFFPDWQLSETLSAPSTGGQASARGAPVNSKRFTISADVVQL